MKRIAKVVLAVSLATAASVGMAAGSSPYPRGAEDYSWDRQTATDTYADRHQGDVVSQTDSPFPTSAEGFPTMAQQTVDTYKHEHHDQVANQASIPGALDADEAPSYWANHVPGGAQVGTTSGAGAQGRASAN